MRVSTGRRTSVSIFLVVVAAFWPHFGSAIQVSTTRSLTLSLIVENLTNETYATTQIVSTNPAFPALPILRPPRYATLRADYRF